MSPDIIDGALIREILHFKFSDTKQRDLDDERYDQLSSHMPLNINYVSDNIAYYT